MIINGLSRVCAYELHNTDFENLTSHMYKFFSLFFNLSLPLAIPATWSLNAGTLAIVYPAEFL